MTSRLKPGQAKKLAARAVALAQEQQSRKGKQEKVGDRSGATISALGIRNSQKLLHEFRSSTSIRA